MRSITTLLMLVFTLAMPLLVNADDTKIWVTDETLSNPPAEDWLMWRRTVDGWAHSPLDQINKDNVNKLSMAWAVAMGPGMQQVTPLVHNGVMYLAHVGNTVQAVDATNGDLIWEYKRELDPIIQTTFLQATRHLAIYEDKIFLATLDAHIVALNAKTGEVVWDHEVADYTFGYRYTSGAIVFKGKVLAGMAGCTSPTPGGCFVTAHDPGTGKELWRVHTLAQVGDPQEASWADVPIERRWGGSAWLSGSFDAETNLTFWGTGVPIPYGEAQRGGKPIAALYTNSTLAIDIDSGELKWYRQHLPRDNWDLDHVFERYVIDRKEGNATRRTVVGALSKLGIVWALDAETGRYLWSRNTIYQNVVKSIHPETGEVEIDESLIPEIGKTIDICPGNTGGKNWNAGTYHPGTGALYLAQNQMCMEYTLKEIDLDKLAKGTELHYPAQTAKPKAAPGKGNAIGRIDAISATTGEILWTYEQPAPWTGALLSTASGLIIGGDQARRLKAFDATTGELLWEIPLASVITGFPVTYAVNGRQYLAVPSGGMTALDLTYGQVMQGPKSPAGTNLVTVFALPWEDVKTAQTH